MALKFMGQKPYGEPGVCSFVVEFRVSDET